MVYFGYKLMFSGKREHPAFLVFYHIWDKNLAMFVGQAVSLDCKVAGTELCAYNLAKVIDVGLFDGHK